MYICSVIERYMKHPVCRVIGPPSCDHQWSRLGRTMPRISSFPDFVLLFLHALARRCAPKLRRQKTSVQFRFDRGYAFRPFSSLLARYRVIMTALWRLRCQSSFAAARSRSALGRGVAPPRPQHARARLLISCLLIFLLFIFTRPSAMPCGISRHRRLMCSQRLLHAARIYYRTYYTFSKIVAF